ncbi:MAG: Crp/Fnr family transcriptional regulator [Betaproteobacteria bacterium]
MSGVDHVAVFARGRAASREPHADELQLGWSEEAWSKLLSRTEPQRFRAGETVIQRGARDRALYFVAAGSLEVGAYPVGEAATPIARVGMGSVIGEQSFFDGQPRSVNVWAVGDGELLRLTPEVFAAFCDDEPALARDLLMALGRVLSLRLRNTTARGN